MESQNVQQDRAQSSRVRGTVLSAADRAGRPLQRFCDEAGISRAMFYKLEPHLRPASVQVGVKRIVTEDPARWLARMGAASGEKTGQK